MSDDGWSNRCVWSLRDGRSLQFTLVPFAGISLIRFRGSRINGLSLFQCGKWALRQDDIPPLREGMYVNYSLIADNSSRRRDIVADGVLSAVGDGEGDEFILQRKAYFQRFADIR